MMGDRFPMGISVRNGLWDDWEGIDGGLHPSTRDDPPSDINLLKAYTFIDHTHSTE
jgi:hypothetical protein